MKTLIILTLLATLTVTAGNALAAHPPLQQEKTVITSIPDKVPVTRLAMLRPHPLLLDIAVLRKEMLKREDELLQLLLEATTETQCNLVIHRLERELKQKINEVLVADYQLVQ